MTRSNLTLAVVLLMMALFFQASHLVKFFTVATNFLERL